MQDCHPTTIALRQVQDLRTQPRLTDQLPLLDLQVAKQIGVVTLLLRHFLVALLDHADPGLESR
ncbi:hypothetical protein D3C71_1807270 [compost metagenome]